MKPTDFDEPDKQKEFDRAHGIWHGWMSSEQEDNSIARFPDIYSDELSGAESYQRINPTPRLQRQPIFRSGKHKIMAVMLLLGCAALILNLAQSIKNAYLQNGAATDHSTQAASRSIIQLPITASTMAEEEENRIHRQINGIDAVARPMTDAEIAAELNDPLALLVLRKGVFPSTLQDVLQALEAQNNSPGGLPTQSIFLVGEGSQIQFSPASSKLKRQLRYVITRSALNSNNVDILISAGAGGAPRGFVQVIAWDDKNKVFNYYERAEINTWVWRGNSTHALPDQTRKQGCFECHVNGSLVMKELKAPWNNWQSQNATVSPSILAPDDPLRVDPLFLNILNQVNGGRGGEDLQQFVIQPGIQRWDTARRAKMVSSKGAIKDVPFLLRQLFQTTTANLTSSSTQSNAALSSGTVDLPLTFFINRDVLLSFQIDLDPGDLKFPIRVPAQFYLDSLNNYQFALVDTKAGFRQPGDTFFAFLVPEPAFEDIDAILSMLNPVRITSKTSASLLTPKFVASVLMVDFQNPVFSEARASLFKYVPSTGKIVNGQSDLPDRIAGAIAAAATNLPPDSPEQQFLANWNLPDDQWKKVFSDRIAAYLNAVNNQVVTAQGFDQYARLAISRRNEFMSTHATSSLGEFELLLPQTDLILAATLEMKSDATVGPK
ncbi:MAG TPA: hypothetical protein VF708_05350 [Pyrinomonadaceae bacterium]|jgi:hypothetical protein